MNDFNKLWLMAFIYLVAAVAGISAVFVAILALCTLHPWAGLIVGVFLLLVGGSWVLAWQVSEGDE